MAFSIASFFSAAVGGEQGGDFASELDDIFFYFIAMFKSTREKTNNKWRLG
jgi:hypothetical protein